MLMTVMEMILITRMMMIKDDDDKDGGGDDYDIDIRYYPIALCGCALTIGVGSRRRL